MCNKFFVHTKSFFDAFIEDIKSLLHLKPMDIDDASKYFDFVTLLDSLKEPNTNRVSDIDVKDITKLSSDNKELKDYRNFIDNQKERIEKIKSIKNNSLNKKLEQYLDGRILKEDKDLNKYLVSLSRRIENIKKGHIGVIKNKITNEDDKISLDNPFKKINLKKTKKRGKKKDFEIINSEDIIDRLSDVRGMREIKEEIDELISMIKGPEKYTDLGIKLHKGILLCGKPGTGKTLLARAIAGESKVNFMFVTGSDFDDTYVGVGAKRIRQLFKTAKQNKPCIVFMDEIDSLLTKSRRTGEHSSSRATINQFLAEMDGFSNLDQVYIIGATNHEKDLDSAATRAGRFDKTIHVPVPNVDAREEILSYYLNKIKLEKSELDVKKLSLMTPGFTGAEIENLINLSIISAVNQKSLEVTMANVSECRDRILMGIARKSFSIPEKNRFKTALHEAGHAYVCYKNEFCRNTLQKLTVVPRGHAAGVTFRLEDDNSLNTKGEFLAHIDVAMGGQVAEEVFYGEMGISAGCSSDLESASSIARQMIKNFAMYGDKVGYQYIENQSYSYVEDEISQSAKHKIDEAIEEILKESRERVFNLINNNSEELKQLAQQCYVHDTLEFAEIDAAIKGDFSKIKAPEVRKPFDFIKDGIKAKSKNGTTTIVLNPKI